MEQILIRNLPAGTKAALKLRAERHHRSTEAEARMILSAVLDSDAPSLADLLGTDDGEDFEFEPERLSIVASSAEL